MSLHILIFLRSLFANSGQFADRGSQYAAAIFYFNGEHQKAEQSKNALEQSGNFNKPIGTSILPAGDSLPAEEYHQKFSH